MSESVAGSSSPDAIPEATVQTKRNISIVWLIPLVAAIIGAFLAWKAISEKGPTITIHFKNAAGLEVDKTKLRYKNVEIGQVTNIELTQDISSVIVTAELRKGAEPYLTDNTRFWVVRARVAAGEVSGLGTLFSGAYIGIDPVTEGEPTRAFVGLERPPLFRTDEPGAVFQLRANSLGSLERGSPVYYRRFKVGQVTDYEMAEDGRSVAIQVFVHAPHHERVRENTVFWNASGLDVSLSAEGVTVDTESFVSVLLGGVSFDTPRAQKPGSAPKKDQVFDLYPSRSATEERIYTEKEYYLLYFAGSVRGLTVGAPVEVRGIKFGEVVDVTLQFDVRELEPRIPVLIMLEPERIEVIGGEDPGQSNLDALVAKGLRAQLKTGSLLTGQLYVDIDIHPDAEPAKVVYEGPYPVLPTLPSSMEELRASLAGTLAKIEKLPLAEIGAHLNNTLAGTDKLVNSPALAETVDNLNATVKDMRGLVNNLDAKVVRETAATLQQAQATLVSMDNSMGPNSTLYTQLNELLSQLADAAQSIRLLADYLERHPEALISGKK